MTNFICTTCGTQHAEADERPAVCAICQDERQYVKATGQQWTTLDRLRLTHRNSIRFEEPGLIERLVKEKGEVQGVLPGLLKGGKASRAGSSCGPGPALVLPRKAGSINLRPEAIPDNRSAHAAQRAAEKPRA